MSVVAELAVLALQLALLISIAVGVSFVGAVFLDAIAEWWTDRRVRREIREREGRR